MNAEDYGQKFNDHLLEQYKIYVEMTDQVSTRRSQTNRFYVSLLSGLLALLSLVVSKGGIGQIPVVLFVAVAILGILLCLLWHVNIRVYRQLNWGKFQVINEMEQHLPFQPYDKEWKILQEGKRGKRYVGLSKVEQFVPFIVALPFLLLLVHSFLK